MPKLPTFSPLYRLFLRADAFLSSTGYEVFDGLRRGALAYAVFLDRFRVWGVRRFLVDLLDDSATFVLVFCFVVLAKALPAFDETADIWNQGRQYAVTLTDASGEIIGRRGIRQDDAVPFEDIPPIVIKAVLATEDARFYDHFGVDVQGTFRAMLANAEANEVVQGGSSITQQLAKNLFLSPERSMKRKIREAFFALWIEARLTKNEILKMYLDRSYLGGGNYGVEAAAQYYFGKSIRDVNLSEAAMLAGLFKAPSKFAPHANVEAARARTNVVLYRMLDVGAISQGELLAARRQPALIINQANIYSPDYFLDYAYRETLDLIDSQNLENEFVIEVKTTIDLKLQQAAQRIINEELDTDAPPYNASQGALVSMEPDGAVKAIVGGRDYADSQFNRATEALRQPGSSFKPFVYLAALMHGFTPTTIVRDGPISVGNWSPRNYNNKYGGRTTLTNALAHSYNSIPVQLMLKIGRKAIIDTAHAVGIQGELENWAPMVLGTSAMTLLDLTTGYATFAAGGLVASPYSVLEIRRPNGDVIYDRSKNTPERVQAVPEEKVAELNSMLHAVVTSGTGRKAFLGFTPQGGKTGTNQSYRDAWFIGFTAHYVTGVWFGNDDFTEMNKMTGGTLPAFTWRRFMMEAEATKVAAGLPGIPLDDSYAKYVAEQEGSLDLPKTADAPAPPAGGAPSPTGSTGGAGVKVANAKNTAAPSRRAVLRDSVAMAESGGNVDNTPRQSSGDSVMGVFSDVFRLFGNDNNRNRRSVTKVKAQKQPAGGFDLFGSSSSQPQRVQKRNWTSGSSR